MIYIKSFLIILLSLNVLASGSGFYLHAHECMISGKKDISLNISHVDHCHNHKHDCKNHPHHEHSASFQTSSCCATVSFYAQQDHVKTENDAQVQSIPKNQHIFPLELFYFFLDKTIDTISHYDSCAVPSVIAEKAAAIYTQVFRC